MEDLRGLYLEELIETALRERLIDACERRADHVVIVQGAMRVMLSPLRAHAFLRGVIQGMSRSRFHPSYVERFYGRASAKHAAPPMPPAVSKEDVPDGEEMLDSFRKHLLGKWWKRYEEAGCPFDRTTRGLMLWIQHNLGTTVN